MCGTIMCAARNLSLHGSNDGRVRVPEEERAVPHCVVDEFAAVDEPLVRAEGSSDVQARRVPARNMGRTIGEHTPGSGSELLGLECSTRGWGSHDRVRIPRSWRRRWESNPR